MTVVFDYDFQFRTKLKHKKTIFLFDFHCSRNVLLTQWNKRCLSVSRKSFSLNLFNYLVSSLISDLISVSTKSFAKRLTAKHSFFQDAFLYTSVISVTLLTINFNSMTKLCSVFKRNVKLFLNVDLKAKIRLVHPN